MRVTPQWAAGFFDGEGSVSVRKDLAIQVQVSSSDRAPLAAIQNRYGGKIYDVGIHGVGTKPIYKWMPLSYEEKIYFLFDIVPYSIVKRKQIEEVLVHIGVYGLPKRLVDNGWKSDRHRIYDVLAEMKRIPVL